MKTISLALVCFFASGCATTLSTLQTARPIEPKHVQVTSGMGFYANLGPVGTVVGQGLKQAQAASEAIQNQEPYTLSEQDQQELLTAGIALAVMMPSSGYELSARTGLVENVDVGFRYSVNALRLDTKYRFFHRGDDDEKTPAAERRSLDMAVGLAGSYFLLKNPVLDALSFVQLDDFKRFDLEVPLYLSAELGDILKLYAAPKYLFSRTTFDEKLVNYSQQATNLSGFDLSLPARVDMHFVGASLGVAAGYRYVHLFLELTSGYTFCWAEVFGQRRSLSGVTIYPAVGLNVKI